LLHIRVAWLVQSGLGRVYPLPHAHHTIPHSAAINIQSAFLRRHFNSKRSKDKQSVTKYLLGTRAFKKEQSTIYRESSKMAVLTVSSSPKTTLATTHSTKPILTLLSPAFTSSLYFAAILQQLLSTTTLFVLFRSYLLSVFLLQQSFHVSQILLIQGLYASSVLGRNAYWVSKQGMSVFWRSTEGIRKKMFKELIIFVLGGGNQLILLVFWPGWIVVGGGVWGVWCLCS
jgi:hypothetical protein